jgi:sulfate adenylyltransferase (ADP) / ATP adenylyltransferase
MDIFKISKKYILYTGLAGLVLVSLIFYKKFVQKKPKSRLRELVFRLNPSCLEKIPTREEVVVEQEITFVVYIRTQESQKPRLGVLTTNPFLYPFEPGILIKNFGSSYRLLFNKYPIISKHLLLVTFQYEKQSDPLTKEDLETAYEVIKDIDGFAFFNSGEHSGFSQIHKHLQIIPYDSISRFPLDCHVSSAIQDEAFTLPMYDFKHFFHAIPANEPKRNLHPIYSKLLNLLAPNSYNFILTQNWMLMVSRAKEKSFNKFELNSIAYAGFLLTKNPEDLEFLKQVGPLAVLRDAAVKN